jgi:segregation and condensation protein A
MEQATNGSAPILANYQLRLPTYEGPFDVLLRLVERSQLKIEDVSLVAVTDQFLAFVSTLDSAPPSVIAEFAAVGARLTVLKSRSLLPKPVIESEELEQSDLTHQLREYQRVKDLARHLGVLHAAGNSAHAPALHGAIFQPGMSKPARLASHDASTLVKSLRRRLSVIPKTPTFIKQRRSISLREVVLRVSELVARATSIRFSAIVTDYRTRSEVATAFLAVLVLVRRQSIDVTQGELFGDIAISPGTAHDQGATLDNDHEFLH